MSEPNPCRVLIMGLHFAPEKTGNAPYTTSLAAGLEALGYSVRVMTSHPHYPEWEVRRGYGQWIRNEEIRGVPVSRYAHFVPNRPSAMMRLLSELSFGIRLLFAPWGKPDVVLLVSPALFSTLLPLVRARLSFRRLAVGMWVQDLYSSGVVETGTSGKNAAKVVALIESLALRSASGVAVIHDRFKHAVVSKLGVSAGKVIVIRNWSHLSETQPFDREAVRSIHNWRGDETVVLHAGNMGAKQELRNVVEAARIADEREAKVRFVLLGDGNQRSQLEELARGVARLQFINTLSDEMFQRTLASADVLLVNEKPGVTEMSVPSKLTSYFTTGLPVLAATHEGSVTAGEISASGGGIRVDAGEPGQLLDAALKLGADKELSAALGAAGRCFRETHLSERAAVARYAEWLVGLAASERLSGPKLRGSD